MARLLKLLAAASALLFASPVAVAATEDRLAATLLASAKPLEKSDPATEVMDEKALPPREIPVEIAPAASEVPVENAPPAREVPVENAPAAREVPVEMAPAASEVRVEMAPEPWLSAPPTTLLMEAKTELRSCAVEVDV